jgi:O-antigen/teichoic acid export membrane protein
VIAEARVALNHTDDATPAARSALIAASVRLKTWFADRSDDSLAQRAAGTAFLIRCVSAALVYGTQILLARWMGGFAFGIYVYVWTWVLLIGGLVDFGLASAAQRFVPEYSKLAQWDLLRGFLRGSRLITLMLAIGVALLGALVIWFSGAAVDRFEVVPLYLAWVALPFFALTRMQEGIARACNWINIALLPPYVIRSLLLVVLMAGGHAVGLGSDAAFAMAAAALATTATAIVQCLLLDRRLSRQFAPGPKRYEVLKWFSTAIPIFMVEGFYLLLTYTDVLMLQQFRPPDEVGIYYAAAKTLALVAFVYFSVSAATAPRFSEYHVAGDRDRLAVFLANTIQWTFWPSLIATAMILALGHHVLRLFGPHFVNGYPLLFILALGLLARAAVGPAERLLNMVGEQRACALVYATAFAVNLTACVGLIPFLGIRGAAIATAIAVMTESGLLFVVTRRRLGLHACIWGGPTKVRPTPERAAPWR